MPPISGCWTRYHAALVVHIAEDALAATEAMAKAAAAAALDCLAAMLVRDELAAGLGAVPLAAPTHPARVTVAMTIKANGLRTISPSPRGVNGRALPYQETHLVPSRCTRSINLTCSCNPLVSGSCLEPSASGNASHSATYGHVIDGRPRLPPLAQGVGTAVSVTSGPWFSEIRHRVVERRTVPL